MARAGLVAAAALALLAAGCGGSSGSGGITVGAARTYELTGFRPAAPVPPGKPTVVAFTITQPDGTPLRRLQARPGAPYGRPPDHRQGRSLDDRPPPSSGRRRRADPPGRRAALLGPLPGRGRRLPREHADGPDQLPALREDHGQRRLPSPAARSGFRASRHGRRLPVHAAPARAAARDPARVPHGHRARPERASPRSSRRGTGPSRTRSSSARARSTTSTPTSAARAPPGARASSARRR